MPDLLSAARLLEFALAEKPPEKSIILIVDDEPLNRFLMTEALAADNYRIVEADSGEAAIEYITYNTADLILLDIDMPGMNGLDACQALRARANGRLVPIAMVTGLDDNHSIEQAFDCGATDFLTKPVNWVLMRQRVRFMLRYGNITRELYRNDQVLEQVQGIAEIGHWQWDFVDHVIMHSPAYQRLIPGLPAVVSDSSLELEATSEYGQLILSNVKRCVQNGDSRFRFECNANLPQRGPRRLLFHGSIEYNNGKPLHLIGTAQDVTQRYQDEERFAAIFEANPVGIIEADVSILLTVIQQPGFSSFSDAQVQQALDALLADPRNKLLIVKANPSAQSMLRHDAHHPLLRALRLEMTRGLLLAARDNQREYVLHTELPRTSDSNRHVVASTYVPRIADEYKRLVISFNDVTDLLQREAQLKRADAIIASSSDAVAVTAADGRILAINPAFTRITGYTFEQTQHDNRFVLLTHQEEVLARIHEEMTHQDHWRGEIEFFHRDGTLVNALMQVSMIRNQHGERDGTVIITSDISHIKESERRLFQLAHFDALTGLPNRVSLQEQLTTELNNAAVGGGFCLLYIDLDGFKLVNDSMGHPTGDALLREVSARIGHSCRPGDLLTRIGGDEFALLMLTAPTREEIDAQANRIFGELTPPFSIKGREIFIGASIGACRYPEDAANAEEMLRNADSAMYEAKRLGRGQLCYYTTELTSVSDRRLHVENELRIGIASNQLFLNYQPKYYAASGAMAGAEALVRWRNPKRGVVPPGEFIGIAESSGLIIPLGEWVINEACRQISEWQRAHNFAIPIAINISALHLRDESLFAVICEAIDRFKIDPQLLHIEITEDSLDFRDGDDRPYIMLNRLAEVGLSIAIDDFGTGYSSLSQLKKMPISTLKIDGSFVRDIADNESDHAIITAIVGLAKTLDMSVVAEGVETEAQANRLRALECDVLQGYLFSKPLPADDFLRLFLGSHAAAQNN